MDRRLVNPDALEEAKERFEERKDSVIVLRVLTKDRIQVLANRTRELRSMNAMRKSARSAKRREPEAMVVPAYSAREWGPTQ